MKKTILFVTYGGGHAHMVYPVVRELRASPACNQGAIDIQVLGMPAAKDILRQNGIDCLSFRDYLDPHTDKDALDWGNALAKDHHSPTIGIDREDSVAYLGLCYKDLVVRHGHDKAAALFKEKSRHAFYPLTILERVFDALKPDFTVATNAPRSEAASIEVANARGIDNMIMTDLFTGWGGYVLRAKNITFLNTFAKDMFAADGLLDAKGSQFYYTGNPAFDRILSLPREQDPAWITQYFPQASGRKLILHADMHAYWDSEHQCSYIKSEDDILEELNVCHAATMQHGAVYLVRPHPSQSRMLYNRWLEGRKDAYLAAECPLHSLLRNVDLVIVRTTTVGLEAAYMQKRIVQLDCEYHRDLPLAQMGIAWGINGYGELADAIDNALTDDTQYEQIKNQFKQMLPCEPAAGKIAGIILDRLAAR